MCVSKQTRTASHAQWVKFHFKRIHPQSGDGGSGEKVKNGRILRGERRREAASSTRGATKRTHTNKFTAKHKWLLMQIIYK